MRWVASSRADHEICGNVIVVGYGASEISPAKRSLDVRDCQCDAEGRETDPQYEWDNPRQVAPERILLNGERDREMSQEKPIPAITSPL